MGGRSAGPPDVRLSARCSARRPDRRRYASGRRPRWGLAAKLALCTFLLGLTLGASAAPATAAVWFVGDFENGTLDGWSGDLARPESAVVVTAPVRKGRHAVRITLAPGDRAASKERAELKVGDKEIERLHGGPGGEIWYGWSLLLPKDFIPPPGDQFEIVAQWHHRPEENGHLVHGPPPLALHLVCERGKRVLLLILQTSPTAAPRRIAVRAVAAGAWQDLVVHVRWSHGVDGFVEAWLDGADITSGKQHGATLYGRLNNYLRLGLYRGKGVPSTNSIYLDEVRLGDSFAAVSPGPP